MPEDNADLRTIQHFSSIIKQATDRVAVEKACQLIDSYVQAAWPECQPPAFSIVAENAQYDQSEGLARAVMRCTQRENARKTLRENAAEDFASQPNVCPHRT